MARWRRLLLPLDDYLAALHACFGVASVSPAERGKADATSYSEGEGSTWISLSRLLLVAVAVLLSWWVYVPIHELAHAFGCRLAGGEVTRLEIDALYGAALLQRLFPFVSVGSDYAGRLTGFDTHGSDLIYLATDFAPFLLTVVVGVPLLRWVAAQGRRSRSRKGTVLLAFGASLPIAYAPFISLTGDYYEMGSIIASRCVAVWVPSTPLERWRSDDVFRLIGEMAAVPPGIGAGDVAVIAASGIIGLALAVLTYAAGAVCSGLIVRPHR